MPSRIVGHFAAQERRPYVRAIVFLPRLRVGAFVDFLIDTGADSTTIHWGQRVSLADPDGASLPDDQIFGGTETAVGIAGLPSEYGVEAALYIFRDETGTPLPFKGDVRISMDPQTDGVPALLGRDLMHFMRLDFDMPNDTVALYPS